MSSRHVVARRLVAVATLVVAIAGIRLAGTSTVRAAATSCGVGAHRVGLVVEHANGNVVDLCVGFGSASVTGEQVLANAQQEFGLQYAVYSSGGDFLCQLDGEPSGYSPGSSCYSEPYWAYFVSRQGAAWQYSTDGIGSTSQQFHDGDSIGFRYESSQAAPPGPHPLPAANPPTPVPTLAPGPAHSGAPTAPGVVGGPAPSTRPATAAPSATASPAPSSAATMSPGPSPSPAVRATSPVSTTPAPPAPPWPTMLAAALAVLLGARLAVVGLRRRRRPLTNPASPAR